MKPEQILTLSIVGYLLGKSIWKILEFTVDCFFKNRDGKEGDAE